MCSFAVLMIAKCLICLQTELCLCSSLKFQLEEEEAKDSFDVDVAVTNPEKVGQFLLVFHIYMYIYDTAFCNLYLTQMFSKLAQSL